MTQFETAEPSAKVERRDVERLLAGVVVLVALGGIGLALMASTADATWSLLGNAASILLLVAMYAELSRRHLERRLGFLRIVLALSMLHPAALIIASAFEEEVSYYNGHGVFSHHEQGFVVAGARMILYASAALAAWLLSGPRTANAQKPFWSETKEDVLRLSIVLSSAYLVAKVTLLFGLSEALPWVAYLLRLYVSYFIGCFFFLGIAVRRPRSKRARGILGLTVALAGLIILSGSRADAILPLVLALVGFVLERPPAKKSILIGAAVGLPILIVLFSLAETLRGDLKGRTGEAALARAQDLQGAISQAQRAESVRESTVKRFISNSLHAVVTRVPSETPFEEDGLSSMFVEMVSKFLPRLNLSGRSETETPRNWMLNKLGFFVSWDTSVELNLIADAWYRGGYWGLVTVGFLVGLALQLLENALYRGLARNRNYAIPLVFVITGLPMIEGRDLPAGIRALVFCAAAGLLAMLLVPFLWERTERRLAVSVGERVRS